MGDSGKRLRGFRIVIDRYRRNGIGKHCLLQKKIILVLTYKDEYAIMIERLKNSRSYRQVWRNGRRTRLKILRGRPRVGSSPTTCIKIKIRSRKWADFCLYYLFHYSNWVFVMNNECNQIRRECKNRKK